jgi:hypothetical protein
MTGVGVKRIFRRELKRFGDWLNQAQGYGQRESGTADQAAEPFKLCRIEFIDENGGGPRVRLRKRQSRTSDTVNRAGESLTTGALISPNACYLSVVTAPHTSPGVCHENH